MKHLDSLPLAVVFLASFGATVIFGSAVVIGAVALKWVARPGQPKQYTFPY